MWCCLNGAAPWRVPEPEMRILIADDESIIRLGLASMLQDLGHEVVSAADGREAITLARQHRPDLAILDIKMPFTDGLQAAQTLHSTQPMPILILTAFSEQDLIEQASDLPIHGYLIKPVQREDVAAAIAVAAKRFRDTARLEDQSAALAEQLETRKLLDRAKAVLMADGMSEESAHRHIQAQARRLRRTVSEVARSIVHAK